MKTLVPLATEEIAEVVQFTPLEPVKDWMEVQILDVLVFQFQDFALVRLTPQSSEHSVEHVVDVPKPESMNKHARRQ